MNFKKIITLSLLVSLGIVQVSKCNQGASVGRFSRLKQIGSKALDAFVTPFKNTSTRYQQNYAMYKGNNSNSRAANPANTDPVIETAQASQGRVRSGLSKVTSGLAAGIKTVIPERILPRELNRKLYTNDFLDSIGENNEVNNHDADSVIPGWKYSDSTVQRGLSSIGRGLRGIGNKLSDAGRRIMPKRANILNNSDQQQGEVPGSDAAQNYEPQLEFRASSPAHSRRQSTSGRISPRTSLEDPSVEYQQQQEVEGSDEYYDDVASKGYLGETIDKKIKYDPTKRKDKLELDAPWVHGTRMLKFKDRTDNIRNIVIRANKYSVTTQDPQTKKFTMTDYDDDNYKSNIPEDIQPYLDFSYKRFYPPNNAQ